MLLECSNDKITDFMHSFIKNQWKEMHLIVTELML